MVLYDIIMIEKNSTSSKVIETSDDSEYAQELCDNLNKELLLIAKRMGLSEHPLVYDYVPSTNVILS